MSRRLTAATFTALGFLGLLGLVACWLLATWTSDDRWGLTAVLCGLVGISSLAYAALLRAPR